MNEATQKDELSYSSKQTEQGKIVILLSCCTEIASTPLSVTKAVSNLYLLSLFI